VSAAARQLLAILRVSLQVDFRSRSPLGRRRSRGARAFLFSLLFYFFAGGVLAFGSTGDLPPELRIAGLLGVAATYMAFNILVEYHQIVLAPADADILYWRPIPSGILFAARVLHVLLYVCILSAALLALPALVVALDSPAGFVPVWLAFAIAGFLNAAAATALTVLAYALLLRYVPWERFQDALSTLQVVLGVVILLGYQALGPVLEHLRTDGAAHGAGWLVCLPAAWFAAFPARVGWGAGAAPLGHLGLGMALVLLSGAGALRVLGPSYSLRLAALATAPAARAAGARPDRLEPRVPLLQRIFAACVARQPLCRSGFDFFLANLRGEQRVKAALLPFVATPVAMVLFALVRGQAADPYAAAASASPSALPLYAGAYLLAIFALAAARSLQATPSWRAAWVFFAAPVRRFDLFYSGLLWGVVFGLLLPAVALLAAVLFVTWRDAFHVLAHLAPPTGLAVVALPLMLRLDPQVPFAREPVRHERSRDLLQSLALLIPVGLVAWAHHACRGHPGTLVLIGSVLCILGAGCWLAVRASLRLLPHRRAFDG